ncbi:MAG: ComF family protein [Patescibacteria group bacterium]|nr:ComF family protein [Patescibacteria group bacterium]
MFIKDIFFPKFCLNCKKPGGYICLKCQKKLLYINFQKCFYCQKISLYNLTHYNCLKNFYIDQVGSVFYYNDFLKKIIKNIKYRFVKEALDELLKLINPLNISFLEFYKKISSDIFIQPIPLHKNKLKERGFNQACSISLYLNRLLNFPIIDFLERVKETKNQAQIEKRQERYLNTKGAFRLKKQIDNNLLKNKRIILVDDVITTGYTVNEAAKVLKKSGVLKVYCFTLAQ